MRNMWILVAIQILSWNAFSQVCADFNGNWGEFVLRQKGCKSVQIIQEWDAYQCSGWPYCQDQTIHVERIEATIHLDTGKCYPNEKSGYSFYCSEHNFQFKDGTILMGNNPNAKWIEQDAKHGECGSYGKRLAFNPESKAVTAQNYLYDCKDGFTGWSEPKVLLIRGSETNSN